jgi:hypothetical protein
VPELDDELLPLPLVEALLVELGRAKATAPAATTLTADSDTVVVVSRRRPRSRSATASAIRRAAARSSLLMSPSVACQAACTAGKTSQLFLNELGC